VASDRQLDAPARQRLRREQALPILEKLQAYLHEQRAAALPKSSLGAAIGYAVCNWVSLTRYAEDGRLKIDNNGAEQALRPIVLGRKNWLFAGSEAAAHRTAILCSLVQTCKHLRINPFLYLRDVIERVWTHPARLVLELAPREWKRLRPGSGAQAAASTVPSARSHGRNVVAASPFGLKTGLELGFAKRPTRCDCESEERW
jgi:transposase